MARRREFRPNSGRRGGPTEQDVIDTAGVVRDVILVRLDEQGLA